MKQLLGMKHTIRTSIGKPIKRVGGKGDFTINSNYKQDGRYYVGESGGLQDFMWGFGMRMAVWSGVLAANDILGKGDYEARCTKAFDAVCSNQCLQPLAHESSRRWNVQAYV